MTPETRLGEHDTTRPVRMDLRTHGVRSPRPRREAPPRTGDGPEPSEHAWGLHEPIASFPSEQPRGPGLIAAPIVSMLLIVEIALVVLHLLVPHTLLFNFDLDLEANVPTWFSGVQLALVAAVLAACWIEEASRPVERRTASRGFGWLLLAIGFGLLSMDEVAQVHEVLGWHLAHADAVHDTLVEAGRQTRAPFLASTGIAWVVLLSPLAALSLGYMVTFLLLRFRDDRKLLAAGVLGVMLFGTALLCEFLSLWTFMGAGYRMQVAVEEGAEMLGVTMFLLVALSTLEHGLASGIHKRRERIAANLERAVAGVACAALVIVSTVVSWMGPPWDKGLDPGGWTAWSSGDARGRPAWHALDRDPATAWTSLGPMRGDEWFMLDLRSPQIVRRACLFVAGYRMDRPRRLSVESSLGGGVFTPWIEDLELPPGRSSLQCVTSELELPVQYLRFSQTGASEHYSWSIAEAYVYD